MKHRSLRIAAALLVAALSPAIARAAPPTSLVLSLDCSDGQHYDINFGAPKNQGTALFIVDDNRILTSSYFRLVVTDGAGGEFVLIESERGLQGLGDQDLLTCTGSVVIDEFGTALNYTVRGWVTPR